MAQFLQAAVFCALLAFAFVDAKDSAGFYRQSELPGAIAELVHSDLPQAAALLLQDERAAWLWLPDRKQRLLGKLRELGATGGDAAVYAELDRRAACCMDELTRPALTATLDSYAVYNSLQVRRYEEMLAMGRWHACVQDFRGTLASSATVLRDGAEDPQVIADYLKQLEAFRVIHDSGKACAVSFTDVSRDEVLDLLKKQRMVQMLDEQVYRDKDQDVASIPPGDLFLECRYALAIWQTFEHEDPIYGASYWRRRLAN